MNPFQTSNMSPTRYGATDRLDRRVESQCTNLTFWTGNCRIGKSELFSTAAPFTYLVLYCVYDILASWSAKSNGGYYTFEPACVVLIVEMGKLIFTLGLLVVFPPSYWPGTSKFFSVCFYLSGPAACYTAINTINLICLAKVSLAHYAVWYQVGIFFNAILWWFAFRRPFGWQRIFALVILAVGCAVNSIGKEGIAISAYVWLVVFCSLISAVGCVLNEYYYKQDARLDLNVQNAILYTLTSVFCVILIAFHCPHRLHSVHSFFEGFQTATFILIGVQVFIGLSVSRILKYASVITKNYVMALHVPIEVVIAHYLIGSHLTIFTFISAVLIGISTCIYYTAGLQEPSPKEKAAAEKAAAKEKAKETA